MSLQNIKHDIRVAIHYIDTKLFRRQEFYNESFTSGFLNSIIQRMYSNDVSRRDINHLIESLILEIFRNRQTIINKVGENTYDNITTRLNNVYNQLHRTTSSRGGKLIYRRRSSLKRSSRRRM